MSEPTADSVPEPIENVVNSTENEKSGEEASQPDPTLETSDPQPTIEGEGTFPSAPELGGTEAAEQQGDTNQVENLNDTTGADSLPPGEDSPVLNADGATASQGEPDSEGPIDANESAKGADDSASAENSLENQGSEELTEGIPGDGKQEEIGENSNGALVDNKEQDGDPSLNALSSSSEVPAESAENINGESNAGSISENQITHTQPAEELISGEGDATTAVIPNSEEAVDIPIPIAAIATAEQGESVVNTVLLEATELQNVDNVAVPSEPLMSQEEELARNSLLARIKASIGAREVLKVSNGQLQNKLSDVFRKRRVACHC
jgi:hypothetical protein